MLRWFFSRREPPSSQTVMLLRHFTVVAESGASLEEALPVLAEAINDRALRNRIALYQEEREAEQQPVSTGELLKALLPRRLAGFIDAGLSHGRLPDVLRSLADQEAGRAAVRGRLFQAMAYPVLVVVLLAAVLSFLCLAVVPPIELIFDGFQLDLPAATEFVLATARSLPWIGVVAVDIGLAIALMLLWKPTCRVVHWLRTAAPVLGRAFIWAGHEQFCSQMATLCGMGVPAPEALRCAAAGQRDLHMGTVVADLAASCERGQRLGEAMAYSRHFEQPLTTVVAAGETHNALPAAFTDAATEYRLQLEQYVRFLSRVMLPIVTIFVTAVVVSVTGALFLPLVSLIENLAG